MSFKDTFLAIVIAGLAISGVGLALWYHNYVTPELADRDQIIQELKDEVSSLQQANFSSAEKDQFQVYLNYYPDNLYNAEERKNILDNYLLPMQAFYNESEERLKAVLIEKGELTALLDDSTVRYPLSSAEAALWQPICPGECQFTNAFYALYPQIVNNYGN